MSAMTEEPKKDNLYCYILRNKFSPDINKTYNGSTNNLKRRIRQHNGELSGGAKRTSRTGNHTWEYYAIVKGFTDKKNMLQCEWRIWKPSGRRKRERKYLSQEGRIKGLCEVLKLEKWTNNSTIPNSSIELDVYIVEEYADILADVPDNIHVHVVKNLMDVIDEL